MARPPIVVSNGGIVDILTKGLDEDQVDTVRTNLKNLIRDEKNGGKNTPKRYWRLQDEGKDPKWENKLNYYKNHDFWKDVFQDMDGDEE
jgi:hypothetical protein